MVSYRRVFEDDSRKYIDMSFFKESESGIFLYIDFDYFFKYKFFIYECFYIKIGLGCWK